MLQSITTIQGTEMKQDYTQLKVGDTVHHTNYVGITEGVVKSKGPKYIVVEDVYGNLTKFYVETGRNVNGVGSGKTLISDLEAFNDYHELGNMIEKLKGGVKYLNQSKVTMEAVQEVMKLLGIASK